MADLVQGYDGSVTLSTGNTLKLNSWSVTVNQDTRQVTGFSDSGWHDNIFGCKSWTATINGYAYKDSGDTPFDLGTGSGISGSLLLTASTGDTFSGIGILSSQDLTRTVCEEAPVTLNFTGKGPLVQAWVGS